MMKQAEVFSDIANLDVIEGEASIAIAQDLAGLVSQGVSLAPTLAQSSQVELALNRVFQELDPSTNVNTSDLAIFKHCNGIESRHFGFKSLQLESGVWLVNLPNGKLPWKRKCWWN